MALAAVLVAGVAVGERSGHWSSGPLPLGRRLLRLAPLLIVALAALPVVAAGSQSTPQTAPAFGATVTRLESTGSNRYAYWRVALRSFAHHPLVGVGAGGFATEWLRERRIDETVQDAHSLELQTAAEEGLVGLAALALLFAGVALAARRVQRRDPALAAGPIAALVVWVVHSAIDWDWQMPALTLLAALLAGLLLARAEDDGVGGVDRA